MNDYFSARASPLSITMRLIKANIWLHSNAPKASTYKYKKDSCWLAYYIAHTRYRNNIRNMVVYCIKKELKSLQTVKRLLNRWTQVQEVIAHNFTGESLANRNKIYFPYILRYNSRCHRQRCCWCKHCNGPLWRFGDASDACLYTKNLAIRRHWDARAHTHVSKIKCYWIILI